jgi:hypothetical protein
MLTDGYIHVYLMDHAVHVPGTHWIMAGWASERAGGTVELNNLVPLPAVDRNSSLVLLLVLTPFQLS